MNDLEPHLTELPDIGMIERVEFWQRLRAGDGLMCPCCNRYAKIYKRRIHHGIVRTLIRLYKEGGEFGFVHISKFCDFQSGYDFTFAQHWGLIEQGANEGKGKTSGSWRLTRDGVDFLRHGKGIPAYMLIYNSTVMGVQGPNVSVHEALGAKFDYDQLMSA